MFLDEPREKLEQGDVLADLTIAEPVSGSPVARTVRAVILSHSCEFQPAQKKRNKHALVVELRPASDAKGGLWNQIKAGKAWSCYYVEDADDGHGESFADFNRVYRVERTQLYPGGALPQRTSMTDEAIEILRYRFFEFVLHKELIPPVAQEDG